jgi:hypothetical protein
MFGAVYYQLRSSGDIWSGSGSADTGDWLSPKVGMSGFQAMATPVSGTCGSGSMTTWLAIADVSWGIGKGQPAGTVSCTFNLQIRHTSNPSVIQGTAQIVLSVTIN